MVKIKICGITTLPDALAAAETGADMLGLNFYPPSPRSISWAAARDLVAALTAELGQVCPLIVGVFANDPWQRIASAGLRIGLDFAQLSGDEPPALAARLGGNGIKAIRPQSHQEALAALEAFTPHAPRDPRAPSLILDAYHPKLYGGTGQEASTEIALAVKACVPRLMLAGGLTPDNVAERVAAIRPWGVDVASGVENGVPGRKDRAKMRAFVEQVRSVM